MVPPGSILGLRRVLTLGAAHFLENPRIGAGGGWNRILHDCASDLADVQNLELAEVPDWVWRRSGLGSGGGPELGLAEVEQSYMIVLRSSRDGLELASPTEKDLRLGLHLPGICWLVLAVGSLRPDTPWTLNHHGLLVAFMTSHECPTGPGLECRDRHPDP